MRKLVIIGLGDPLRDFRFGKWRSLGSKSSMIEVYIFPEAYPRSYLVRLWRFFRDPANIKEDFLRKPYKFTFIVRDEKITYPAKMFKISFYLYTEAVFVSYNESIRLIDENLGIDVDLSKLNPMKTKEEPF